MLSENSLAPNFSLPDKEGVFHSLQEFLGVWVLLYFYPKDDTPGCTKEACGLRDNFPHFEKLKIKILGVSGDSSESHTKFSEKYNLPFTLLADEKKEVLAQYGANEVGKKRISYLIDPEGIIRKAYRTVAPEKHAEEVLKDWEILSQ